MKLLIQRVTQASVSVDNEIISEFSGQGLLVLLGLGRDDSTELIPRAIEKIRHMRIFSNQEGRFDFSLDNVEGFLMLVPQFTLFADASKGRRPEFFSAMPPDKAEPFFNQLFKHAQAQLGHSRVLAGRFGANMQVSLVNDGPVTISLELEK